MSRFLFGSRSSKASIQSKADADGDVSATELHQLQTALKDADLIMNDDIDTAAENLKKGDSAFHILGQGILLFLQAALGAEQDVMKRASDSLYHAESVAYQHQKRAERSPQNAHSIAYPPGTEYLVCQAQAMILGAVVGIMRESLTDALRGFYKLRKALGILETVSGYERTYIAKQKAAKGPAASEKSKATPTDDDDDDQDEFHDVQETPDQDDNEKALAQALTDDALIEHPIDQWIQSCTLCQYGMLQVMISLIPPAWGRLLSIVGFNGDRARGQAMLWRATQHDNINGAVAALVLMGVANGLVSFLDIKPPGFYPKARLVRLLRAMRTRYPQSELWRLEEARMQSVEQRAEACVALLGTHSGPLGEPAVHDDDDTSTDRAPAAAASERKAMKQVMALQAFERALNAAYCHAYRLSSRCFLRCAELNTWSLALYYYFAAGAQLELYRVYRFGGLLPAFPADATQPTPLTRVAPDPARAAKHRARAAELYREIPGVVGKRRLFAKQLPLDGVIARKLAKWEARAKTLDVDFIDAIGVSPVEEMIFLFGGFGRMPPAHLGMSLARLAWSDGDTALVRARECGAEGAEAVPAASPLAAHNNLDERTTLAVLRACLLRQLGRAGEARALLQASVLGQTRGELGACAHAETWTQPMARFEMAAAYWAQRHEVAEGEETVLDQTGAALSKAKLRECARWLDEVAGWGAFELDVRMGPKITTGRETLRELGFGGGGAS